MAFGLVVKVTFLDEATEDRFKLWAERGNAVSVAQGTATLGLRAHLFHLEGREYLFYWEHMFYYSFSYFLRFMLWVVSRKIRKGIRVESISKCSLMELMFEREGLVL